MSFFEDTKKFIDFDTLSYLVKKLRDENQSTYLNSSDLATNEDVDYIFQKIESKKYLTIEALEDGLTVSLSMNACEYCIDESGDWKTLSVNTPTESIDAGQTLSFRGNLIPTVDDNLKIYGIGTFTISKKCNVLGNVMSMLFGDDGKNRLSLSGKDYSFYKLFYNCSNIISAKDLYLPATTLTEACYYGMFGCCTSLTTAPELPATTLANSCYSDMFGGCTGLTTAPAILPATTLTKDCYGFMFSGCKSLTTVPELPATIMKDHCYYGMFYNCTSLTTAPELPATTLAEECYAHMFEDCTSLTQAPELPATTLADYCYYGMFSGCTSLTDISNIHLPATNLATECYTFMFSGCTSLTDISNIHLLATNLATECYWGMFQNCTSLTTAPELPATTLADKCYAQMFQGCTSLNHIKMLATDISASRCLNDWVSGVASTGTFIKHPDMTLLPAGTSGIPSGWDVVDVA